MKAVPQHYGTEQWEVLLGGAWVALVNWAIGMEAHRKAFERETGHSLDDLTKRSSLDALIDDATGRTDIIMAAWCDWVTVNLWGIETATSSTTATNTTTT